MRVLHRNTVDGQDGAKPQLFDGILNRDCKSEFNQVLKSTLDCSDINGRMSEEEILLQYIPSLVLIRDKYDVVRFRLKRDS